jgi:hypothetical protein
MRALAAVLFVGGLLAVASLSAAQQPENPKGAKGNPGQGAKGDQGGKGGRDFPGRAPGAFGPSPLGQILPLFVQDQLKLSDAQKKELEAMQKDVDAKLEKLLTDDQKKALKELKERGPNRGPGGPPGPGGNNRPPSPE